ncbi:MAG: transketolase family protein [Patescibacteria group bacterium]|jgi:transketolase|nr:transketolase family protein [Patescibacteria group bacterium]
MNNLHLKDINKDDILLEPIRKGFGNGLLKAGELDDNVVALCADLTDSTFMHYFKEAYPDRFFQVGIAEQNLVTVASGLASMGKIPFATSYAAFSPGRNWEQIKTTIALNNVPVKIVGSHAGLYTGHDGATHQMLEDIALMRVMPNMVVVVPGDALEAQKATMAIAKENRPAYLRLTREPTAVFTSDKTPFEIGKAYIYEQGDDVTIISTGVLTYQAMIASEKLFKDGISAEIIHCPTIKPLDNVTILESVKKTGAVVTVEEAQINGGLGGAIAELLAENQPSPIRRIGVKDTFGQSGDPAILLENYGLTAKNVQLAVHELLHSIGKI